MGNSHSVWLPNSVGGRGEIVTAERIEMRCIVGYGLALRGSMDMPQRIIQQEKGSMTRPSGRACESNGR